MHNNTFKIFENGKDHSKHKKCFCNTVKCDCGGNIHSEEVDSIIMFMCDICINIYKIDMSKYYKNDKVIIIEDIGDLY